MWRSWLNRSLKKLSITINLFRQYILRLPSLTPELVSTSYIMHWCHKVGGIMLRRMCYQDFTRQQNNFLSWRTHQVTSTSRRPVYMGLIERMSSWELYMSGVDAQKDPRSRWRKTINSVLYHPPRDGTIHADDETWNQAPRPGVCVANQVSLAVRPIKTANFQSHEFLHLVGMTVQGN